MGDTGRRSASEIITPEEIAEYQVAYRRQRRSALVVGAILFLLFAPLLLWLDADLSIELALFLAVMLPYFGWSWRLPLPAVPRLATRDGPWQSNTMSAMRRRAI